MEADTLMTGRAGTLVWCGVVCLASVSGVVAQGDLRLVDAVKSQDRDAARALLERQVDVTAAQGGGTTALHWAAHWNDLETADQLITAGANVNAETNLGVTPLYLASEIGSAAMTKTLLEAGANPNVAAGTGVSPLMLAARAGAVDAVRAFLSHGAHLNATQHSSGQTAPDVGGRARALGRRACAGRARSRHSRPVLRGPEARQQGWCGRW